MRIAELDGLRGIGIIAVLGVHSVGWFRDSGWLAIDVFFVLSGYLITRALVRDPSLPRFYGRRVVRILPPLAAAIALAYAIAPGFDFAPGAYFYANFLPLSSLGSLGHVWYLSIEEQFYLLWPLAFLFLPRGPALAVVIGSAWLFHISMAFDGTDVMTIHTSTFSRMDALAIGCAFALARPRVGKAIGWAAFVTALFALFAAKAEPLTMALGLALYPVLCAGLIGAGTSIRPLSFKPLVYLGERSFGIYLYHFPIVIALMHLQQPGHRLESLVLTALKIGLPIALAELSYRTIERWTQNIDFGKLFAPHAEPSDATHET